NDGAAHLLLFAAKFLPSTSSEMEPPRCLEALRSKSSLDKRRIMEFPYRWLLQTQPHPISRVPVRPNASQRCHFLEHHALPVTQRQQPGESIQMFSRYEQMWRHVTNELTFTMPVLATLLFW
ncbi:hypothetical protein AABB24_030547, partial [Solanum stoloniferum]